MPLSSHWSPRNTMFRTVARVLAVALPLLSLSAAAAPKARIAVLPVAWTVFSVNVASRRASLVLYK